MNTIVTFYSFKGGVGRTMALANIAVQLAERGRKVLAVDWDLEAPGLHRYFDGRLEAPPAGGLLSLLHAACENADTPPSWRQHVSRVDLPYPGTLDVLPAVDRFDLRPDDDSYARRLQQLNWHEFFRTGDGGAFVEDLRDEWRETYDVTLVDSRTGYTDSGGVCTIQLPDVLVAVFTANEQSLAGLEEAIHKAQAARQRLDVDRPPLLVVPLPSRFDGRVEIKEAERWMKVFATRLAPYYDDWLPRGTSYRRVIERTRVPHVPFYSFGEKLPAIDQSDTDPEGMAYAYGAVTRLIEAEFENADVVLLGERADPTAKTAAEAVGQLAEEVEQELRQCIRRAQLGRSVLGALAVISAVLVGLLVISLQLRDALAVSTVAVVLSATIWRLAPSIRQFETHDVRERLDALRVARRLDDDQPGRLREEIETAQKALRAEPRPGPQRPMTWKWEISVALTVVTATAVVALLIARSDEASRTAVRPAWLDDPASGPVRLCSGDDQSGAPRRSKNEYNRTFVGSRASLVQTSFAADSQHDLYLRQLRGEYDCDVVYLDVAYTAEFAARNLLYDMTPYLRAGDRRTDFNPLMLKTAEYEGKLWGVPKQFDVGVLYYRADRARAPRSWRELSHQATPGPGGPPGLRLQLDAYEGLTVALLDLAYAAGADSIISDDGKTANVDQPEVLAAVRFLRDAIRKRALPRSSIRLGDQDQASLSLYEFGQATFLRGWPYVAARLRDDENAGRTALAARVRRRTAAHTRIVPLPPWNPGGPRVAVLGGRNLVIPRSAPNPSGALHLIDFLTSTVQIFKDVEDVSPYPVLRVVASDPAHLRNRPLVLAIQDTRVIMRPPIPQYADASAVISSALRRILSPGFPAAADPAQLREINSDVQRVLDGSP